jgi:hypothetical protein
LEETLLKKGFFQAIFPKLLKVLRKGFKGKTLFQKGFPLKLMALPPRGEGEGAIWLRIYCSVYRGTIELKNSSARDIRSWTAAA